MSGAELIAVVEARAGGSILMEKLTNSRSPQMTGEENVYLSDSSLSIYTLEEIVTNLLTTKDNYNKMCG